MQTTFEDAHSMTLDDDDSNKSTHPTQETQAVEGTKSFSDDFLNGDTLNVKFQQFHVGDLNAHLDRFRSKPSVMPCWLNPASQAVTPTEGKFRMHPTLA